MIARARIGRLERLHAGDQDGAPDVEALVAEAQRVARWLDERGLTAEEALARGEKGLEGTWLSLALVAQGNRELKERDRSLFETTSRNETKERPGSVSPIQLAKGLVSSWSGPCA